MSTRLFADSIVETSVSNLPDTALRSAWTLSRVDSCDNALVVFFTTLALGKTEEKKVGMRSCRNPQLAGGEEE